MKRRNYILIAILAIALIGAFIGWRMYNKGPKDVLAAYGLKVKATDLYHQFSKDSIKANIQFGDKVLEIKGILKSQSNNNQNEQVLLLESGIDGASVNCTMEERSNHKEGDPVTIKGICSGMGQGDEDLGIKGDVYIIRAYAIK